MRNTALYGISIFTLTLMAIAMFGSFLLMVLPFEHVQLKKITPLKPQYYVGEMLEKKILICKDIDTPVTITLEIANSDIIPLAFKRSYQPRGCKEYIISQPIPSLTKIGEHKLLITVSYEILFRNVNKTLQSDIFIVTASPSALLVK